MAENNESIILDLKVDIDQANRKIADYRGTIEGLKNDLKATEDAYKKGLLTMNEYRTEVGSITSAISRERLEMNGLVREVNNQIKADQAAAGSVKQLRAELSNATAAYDRLSAAERNGATGQAYVKHINDVTNQLKAAEEATQRYSRGVGNYQNSITGALAGGNRYIQMLMQQATASKSATEAMKAGAQGVQALGKQFLALLANPIVATLAAIVAVIKLFSDAVTSSQENTEKWERALAPLKGVLDAVLAVVQKGVGFILDLAGAFAEAATVMLNFMSKLPGFDKLLGGVTDSINNQTEAAKKRAEFEKMSNKQIEQSAKNEEKVSKLRTQAADKANFSTEQRRKFLQEALEVEKQESKQRQALAKKNLEALEAEARTTENSAEMERKLAEARAAVTRANTAYYDSTRRIVSQLASFDQQEQAEAEAKAKEAADKRKAAADKAAADARDRRQKELDAVRAAEDAMTALITDELERREREINLSYDRQIEDLRRKLAEEKNLTVTARQALNEQMNALEQQRARDLEDNAKAAFLKDLSETEAYYRLVAENAAKGSAERYEAEKIVRTANMQKEIAEWEGNSAMIEEIRRKYARQEEEAAQQARVDAQNEANAAQAQAFETRLLQMQNEGAERLAQMRANGASELALQQEQDAAELEQLRTQMEAKHEAYITAQQMEGESDEAFALRKEQLRAADIQASEAYNNKQKAIADKEVKIQQDKAKAIGGLMGGLSSMLEKLGEDNKAAAKASKVLALGEIIVNMGVATAEGIKQAQKAGPFPANIAAIATTITAIVAGITSAISTVKSAKFAEGGLVTGPGTGTSDSIPAMLSNGEFVVKASATEKFAPLLTAINEDKGLQIGLVASELSSITASTSEAAGAVAAESIAVSVSEALAQMPAPVVSVEEITRTQNNVKVLQTLGNV